MPVDLPQGEAPNLQHKEPVTLTITKDSQIFLDKTPATLDDMAFALKPMLQAARPRRGRRTPTTRRPREPWCRRCCRRAAPASSTF